MKKNNEGKEIILLQCNKRFTTLLKDDCKKVCTKGLQAMIWNNVDKLLELERGM